MTNSTASAAFLLRVRFDADVPRQSQLTKSEWSDWAESLVTRGLVSLADNEFALTSAGDQLVDRMVAASAALLS